MTAVQAHQLATNVKQLRHKKEWTQVDLAYLSDLSLATIQGVELSRMLAIRQRTVSQLVKTLGINFEEILGIVPTASQQSKEGESENNDTVEQKAFSEYVAKTIDSFVQGLVSTWPSSVKIKHFFLHIQDDKDNIVILDGMSKPLPENEERSFDTHFRTVMRDPGLINLKNKEKA
jgi:transcriptional regulator with XRE-family HTH domain